MSISGKDFSVTVGGSDDNYTGQGRIWEIAERFNKQSRAMHYEGSKPQRAAELLKVTLLYCLARLYRFLTVTMELGVVAVEFIVIVVLVSLIVFSGGIWVNILLR